MIIGVVGLQGSGKSSFIVQFARKFQKLGVNIYSNMNVEGFTLIKDYADVPFDNTLKYLVIDEAMFSLDSRSFSSKDNKVFSRFLAYLRKINCGLIWATHFVDLIDVRLRQQTSLYVVMKKESNNSSFIMLDPFTFDTYRYHIPRTKEFFDFCNYNTYDMPTIIKTDKLLTLKQFNI
jgi:GTPase SAR1 family protein